MIITANIDYNFMPEAIATIGDKQVDLYPHLGKQAQKKINRTYDHDIKLNISNHILKKIHPQFWKQSQTAQKTFLNYKKDLLIIAEYLQGIPQAKEIIKTLPPHMISVTKKMY